MNRSIEQIAHDLRSPLAALEVLLADILAQAESPHLQIRMALDRLHAIADSIQSPSQSSPDSMSWIAEGLVISPDQHMIVADDDESIHAAWMSRFQQISAFTGHLSYFRSPEACIDFVTQNPDLARRALFLVDYDFSLTSTLTGLDIVDRCAISTHAILVTSRSEDALLSELERLPGIRHLAKRDLPSLPIRIMTETVIPACDAILIDNDTLIRNAWAIAARKHQKTIRTFEDYSSFRENSETFERAVPIYLDEDLGSGLSGTQLIAEIRALGFTQVTLATGYARINPSTGLQIQGKMPPW